MKHSMVCITFILFLSAFFMNWPLLNNVEGQHQMKNIYKIGYIIANAVLITPACALNYFCSESAVCNIY